MTGTSRRQLRTTARRHSCVWRAFSLVELVLVLAIMGTVAAIAVPRYAAANNNYRAATAAQRLATDLRLAQQRAKHGSASVAVTFHSANNSYEVAGEASLQSPDAAYVVSLPAAPYRARLTHVDTGSADDVLTFNGFGLPRSLATFTVATEDVTRTVTVSAGGSVGVR